MDIESKSGKKIFGYLPERIYGNSKIIQNLFDSIGMEIDLAYDATDDLLFNSFLSQAEWSLPKWEAELGLAVNPSSINDDDRRARLQFTGRLTTKTINAFGIYQIISFWKYGQIRVEEDYPNYTVKYTFNGTAIPSDIEKITKFLRQITPAGLEISVNFSFTTWDTISGKEWTWNDLEDAAETWDLLEIYET